LLDSNQVEWIESAGNYVHVHSGGRTYVIRTTMDRVARRLAVDTFLRVRRTALISATDDELDTLRTNVALACLSP